jgi:flavin-binding protein dodecin
VQRGFADAAWAALLQICGNRRAAGNTAGKAAPLQRRREKRWTIALPPGPAAALPPGTATRPPADSILQENRMNNHVYKHIELTGSSTKNIEDAVSGAIAKASLSLRNIHWFEVVETRGHVENGKVAHWQVTIKVGFTLED